MNKTKAYRLIKKEMKLCKRKELLLVASPTFLTAGLLYVYSYLKFILGVDIDNSFIILASPTFYTSIRASIDKVSDLDKKKNALEIIKKELENEINRFENVNIEEFEAELSNECIKEYIKKMK